MKLVHVREFYQKDGEWSPGTSGITMNKEQFAKFCSEAPKLSDSLKSRSEYQFNLSAANGKGEVKQACVNEYKGVFRVGIREWYQDKSSGQLKPTKKGVNLTAPEWGVLESKL